MSIDLGMPQPAAEPLAPRRKSRQIMVGKGKHAVPVGGGAPVSVQSMCTTVTADVNATLQQIAELTASGCQIVRVAVPSQDDADALPEIARKSQIPVIADIHFQPKYVFAAIDAGCGAVRVNPGNIKAFDDKVAEIARAASAAEIPIRIGVNAGSLDKRLLAKHGRATAAALVESALWECSLFEEHGFTDIKISVKHHDPVVMIAAYRQLAQACDYPLHLGVTEAGPAFQGTVKSATAFGALLAEGIGDTIRVSLSAPPVEEVKVGNAILESLGLRDRGLEIVSCPSCGRAQVDVYTLADQVTAGLEGLEVPLRVAVMGCVVNGPGEAREADLGVASGNGKGQIFVKGEVIKTVPESQIVETLIEEAMKLAEAMPGDQPPGHARRSPSPDRRLARRRDRGYAQASRATASTTVARRRSRSGASWPNSGFIEAHAVATDWTSASSSAGVYRPGSSAGLLGLRQLIQPGLVGGDHGPQRRPPRALEPVPDRTAAGRRVVLEVVEQAPGIAGQVGRVERHLLQEPGHVGREGRLEELVLVAEVGVDHRLVAARRGGDAVDPGAGDAEGRELIGRGGQQPPPGPVRVTRHRPG